MKVSYNRFSFSDSKLIFNLVLHVIVSCSIHTNRWWNDSSQYIKVSEKRRQKVISFHQLGLC